MQRSMHKILCVILWISLWQLPLLATSPPPSTKTTKPLPIHPSPLCPPLCHALRPHQQQHPTNPPTLLVFGRYQTEILRILHALTQTGYTTKQLTPLFISAHQKASLYNPTTNPKKHQTLTTNSSSIFNSTQKTPNLQPYTNYGTPLSQTLLAINHSTKSQTSMANLSQSDISQSRTVDPST